LIEKQEFGNTGHRSTRAIFGSFALARTTPAHVERTLDVLLEYGVNHIDTAADYGDSEARIGKWMGRHRGSFFLATKSSGRSYRQVRDDLHRSLGRLRVEHVDLLQLHNLVDPVDWRRAMASEGALEAAMEAREEGLVRFIGVTGHGVSAPTMHMKSLERFDFDAVLLPYNYPMTTNSSYVEAFDSLARMCREQRVAVQTIKSIAQGMWAKRPGDYNTWYVPLTDQSDIDLAVHWVLGHPTLFLITAGDVDLLPKVLDAASRFSSRPSEADMDRLVAKNCMAPLFI